MFYAITRGMAKIALRDGLGYGVTGHMLVTDFYRNSCGISTSIGDNGDGMWRD